MSQLPPPLPYISVPIRKYSYLTDQSSWTHFPYRTDLSIDFNTPQSNNPKHLLVKICWKLQDLERFPFASNEKCKAYAQYPSIAIKYYPKDSPHKKKVQVSFNDHNDFNRCIQALARYGVQIVDNDSKEATSSNCSQPIHVSSTQNNFQLSQSSRNGLQFSQKQSQVMDYNKSQQLDLSSHFNSRAFSSSSSLNNSFSKMHSNYSSSRNSYAQSPTINKNHNSPSFSQSQFPNSNYQFNQPNQPVNTSFTNIPSSQFINPNQPFSQRELQQNLYFPPSQSSYKIQKQQQQQNQIESAKSQHVSNDESSAHSSKRLKPNDYTISPLIQSTPVDEPEITECDNEETVLVQKISTLMGKTGSFNELTDNELETYALKKLNDKRFDDLFTRLQRMLIPE